MKIRGLLGGAFTCLVTARCQLDWAVRLPEAFTRPAEEVEEMEG